MTMTTNTQSNGRGIVNHAVIRVVEDATAAVVETFTVGFQPRQIVFENITDSIRYDWYQGMADLSAVKTLAAGSRSLNLTEGPTVTSGGFTMPAAAMIASKVYNIAVFG